MEKTDLLAFAECYHLNFTDRYRNHTGRCFLKKHLPEPHLKNFYHVSFSILFKTKTIHYRESFLKGELGKLFFKKVSPESLKA